MAQDANILSFIRHVNITKHALEALQVEMGIMHMQLREVTLEGDALREELVACQTKCLGLKQDVATLQKSLQEALARATET